MSPEAVELDLYIHQDFALWKAHEAIEASMAKKIVKGVYNPELAIKGWLNLVDRAARAYARDNRMSSAAFDSSLRREVATEFERRFYRKHMGMRKGGISSGCSNCGGHHDRKNCPNIDYARLPPVTYGCGVCKHRFGSMEELIAHQETSEHQE